MSPLCPLLAIAALLVASAAATPRLTPNCIERVTGIVTVERLPFTPVYVAPLGGQVAVDSNACHTARRGETRTCGEYVKACNRDLNGARPDVDIDDDFSPVDVSCPNSCPSGVDVTIVQYCC